MPAPMRSFAMSARKSGKPCVFNIANPFFLFGVFSFLVNHYLDTNYDLPLGELVILGLTALGAIQSRALTHIVRVPGFWLLFAFMAWITLANFANGVTIPDQMRNSFAVSTIFIPILLYIMSDDRRIIMSYMLGATVGFGLFFLFFAFFGPPEGESVRTLRNIQPTPVVPLLLYLVLRRQISSAIGYLLLAVTLVSLLTSFVIEARGPVLSLIIAAAFVAMARVVPAPRPMMVLGAVACLTSHVWIYLALNGEVVDFIYRAGADTASNVERAAAIEFSMRAILEHPVFGISPKVFFWEFLIDVRRLMPQLGYISTPHNSLLEYMTFFGIPAGLIFMALMGRMLLVPLKSPFLTTLVVALAMGGVVRLAAFYGISGIWRIEWFCIMFALYYTWRPFGAGKPASAPQSPATPPAAKSATGPRG